MSLPLTAALLDDQLVVLSELVMRLRTMELLVSTGELRFVGHVGSEIEVLSHRLAELELARLALVGEQADVDDVVDVLPTGVREHARTTVDRLRLVTAEVDELRERVRVAGHAAVTDVAARRRRLEASAPRYDYAAVAG